VVRVRSRDQTQNEDEADGLYENLATASKPISIVSEAYRGLRTNLFYSEVPPPSKVVLVASPGSAEGQSITFANLRIVLAHAGNETLILDGDLREPTLQRIFGVRNPNGLVNVILGEQSLPAVWKEPLYGRKVVAAG
jgi:Mrp family chromosome partitioning ATPase